MGPGFESLKVHQEKRDVKLHLFFLATFVGGEPSVRPIAKQWHEERSDEVVPETLLLHLFFLATFVGGELLVRPIAQQWHEPRRREVVPKSAHTPQGVYFMPVLSCSPRRRRREKIKHQRVHSYKQSSFFRETSSATLIHHGGVK